MWHMAHLFRNNLGMLQGFHIRKVVDILDSEFLKFSFSRHDKSYGDNKEEKRGFRVVKLLMGSALSRTDSRMEI